jgi:phosphoglucomutase
MHIIRYNRWLAQALEDSDLTAELAAVKTDAEAIRDRFAIDLSFGTAGMRGVIGAGTNRMNIYTVRRATQGLACFLKRRSGKQLAVAVGYDSRIKSELFAKEAARVLATNGISVHLWPQLEPVPLLSFSVRHLSADAGIMITASHNPAKYNGYKVYGPDGCQMNTKSAGAVLNEISRLDIFSDVPLMPYAAAVQAGRILPVSGEVLAAYYRQAQAQAIRPGPLGASGLSVVYSPLNGTGNVPVRHVLGTRGLTRLAVVKAQEMPNGNFPTAPYPNPENPEALALGITMAQQTDADLVLATDPDCDRVGIAVRGDAGSYRLMSGNEVGVLLLNYICEGRADAGTLPPSAVMVKSIVSTPMADAVARRHGVACEDVLTGFKYIGERILQLEKQGEATRFIFGFEESSGYLSGTYVRDKDGVAASMLICEMAAFYKSRGLTLCDAMEALYTEYGRYLAEVDSFEFAGLSGMAKMDEIMAQLRKTPLSEIGGLSVVSVADYQTHIRTDLASGRESKLGLPASNVVAYTLSGGSIVTVRPSGTEPKVKVYYAVREATLEKARALHKTLAAAMQPMMAGVAQ